MNLIRRLFSSDDAEPKQLLCPHCERPLNDKHTEDKCKAGHSRRFFVQMLAGCAVVATIPASIERAAATILATPEHIRQEERRQKSLKVHVGRLFMVNGDHLIETMSQREGMPGLEALKRMHGGYAVFHTEREALNFYWNRNAKTTQMDSGLLVVENARTMAAGA